MSLRNEDARGWIGTIVFHLFVALVLFLWKLDLSASEPGYIELSWGSVADVSPSRPAHPSKPGSEGTISAPLISKSKPLDLPERRLATDDEVLRLPPTTKMAADEKSYRIRTQLAENSKGMKDRGVGSVIGQKEKFTAPGIGENAGEIADPLGAGFAGSSVGKSVSASMQWSGGGTRKKISGALPEYPEGVKVETQIKIELTVSPDGSVKSLRPAQKGNMKLEEVSLKETRLWKFEPLHASSPQRDQACVVTFNFQLR
jgi:outer membrane biosynthesis protein TonB